MAIRYTTPPWKSHRGAVELSLKQVLVTSARDSSPTGGAEFEQTLVHPKKHLKIFLKYQETTVTNSLIQVDEKIGWS
jgi:hypothetical protein